jgi:hypothetical protein
MLIQGGFTADLLSAVRRRALKRSDWEFMHADSGMDSPWFGKIRHDEIRTRLPGDLIHVISSLDSFGPVQYADNAHRGSNQAHATF